MAKYSTGSGGGDEGGGSCELCGRETSDLSRSNVAGAELLVCSECAPHGDNRHKDRKKRERQQDRDSDEPNRKKRAAQSAAKAYDATKADGKRWEEEGTNYEKDRLPYLVSGYGDLVESARQEAGLRIEELAADLDIEEDDLLAVEQGRAARANVGGSVVRKLEETLGVDIIDE
jgi:ribosome-binding protein aMBF1 (putative translation factor)